MLLKQNGELETQYGQDQQQEHVIILIFPPKTYSQCKRRKEREKERRKQRNKERNKERKKETNKLQDTGQQQGGYMIIS